MHQWSGKNASMFREVEPVLYILLRMGEEKQQERRMHVQDESETQSNTIQCYSLTSFLVPNAQIVFNQRCPLEHTLQTCSPRTITTGWKCDLPHRDLGKKNAV